MPFYAIQHALEGSGEMDGFTADTFQHYRIIMFADGTTRAIPYDTVTPGAPTGLTGDVKLSSVTLSWVPPVPPVGGASYAVLRDGTRIATTTSTTYKDITVVTGSTYDYTIQTVDTFGQRSAQTSAFEAFIDPALNVAPTVTVTCWPALASTNGRTILRVNAGDADAQTLALALEVDAGSITETEDPSVWMYTP